MADAEDIVQEVFVAVSNHDWDQVQNVKAYLTKVTTNRCLNLLQSSYRQRELYVGPWLPEPMQDESATSQEPEEVAEKKESIRYALLVLLHTLTPQERAVFILREILGFTYSDIADAMDRTESNCRKIFSRAKKKMTQIQHETIEGSKQHTEMITELFIEAIETGEFSALTQQLLQDVTLITDGGGKVKAAYKPIFGMERVLAFLQGVREKGAYDGKLIPVSLNSETGIVLSREGRNVLMICFDLDSSGHIRNIFIVMNPEKLRLFQNVSLN